MKNSYRCDKCKGVIVTINVDDGTTPFALGCRAKDGCDGLMYSGMYQPNIYTHYLPAEYEWFKPESTAGLDDWIKDHVERGGLILRKAELDEAELTKKLDTLMKLNDAIKAQLPSQTAEYFPLQAMSTGEIKWPDPDQEPGRRSPRKRKRAPKSKFCN